ncbi:hypothetical protein RB595_002669 [Gaeumannomyces hyphopodioides]
MLQGQLQHTALRGEDWSMQPRTGRVKNNHQTIDMPILHQEQEDMTQPVRISFDPVGWSNACARSTPCRICITKSAVHGTQECLDCSSNFAKSLPAASSAPGTPAFTTKREPRDSAELLGREAMSRTMSAMSYESVCRSSVNDGLVGDMDGMADAFQNSPGGYSAYSQTPQIPFSQATSQFDPNDNHFEYNVSLCGESLDACQPVSPMDQSMYPMPYACSTSSSQVEGPLMFMDTQQHMMELPPSPAQTAEISEPSPKEKFKCSQSGCGRSFSRHADLQRHYDHVHPGPDSTERGHACDYPKCTRQVTPFRRKDHFRDHLREFHKEDLLRRGGQETADWFNGRNINPSVWRCGRCLRRNSFIKRGYTCFKCNVDCEPTRVEHRQKQRRATVQGPVRTSKKSQPAQRMAARLAQNLPSLDTLSPSAMPATSWRGPATAPATASNMMLFAHTSPYAEVNSPSSAIFYPEDQLPPSK